jgi:hypothetical protein
LTLAPSYQIITHLMNYGHFIFSVFFSVALEIPSDILDVRIEIFLGCFIIRFEDYVNLQPFKIILIFEETIV